MKLGFFIIGVGVILNIHAQDIDRRVDSVLSLMTLEEKIGQMNQYTGSFDQTGPIAVSSTEDEKAEAIRSGNLGSMLNVYTVDVVRETQRISVEESRLGIPLIFALDVIHGYKTSFPIPLAEAASWDLAAIEHSARIAAIEASAAGINWTFAPMVDISRDPRWGRIIEGAGEDTYLGSKVAYARVKGFQTDDLSASNSIAACAKHFAAYGFGEAGREYNTVDISMRTLHDVVFPPFKACVDAGVATFMNGFNEISGIPATGNSFLQRDVLKGQWNYDGVVVSDWGSIGEMVNHGVAANKYEAAKIAVKAGSDMDMESRSYQNNLKKLIENGEIDEALIDDAVRRILRLKFELGLFDDPYKYCDNQREKNLMKHPDHLEAARDVAKKSIVLLKNDQAILPLKRNIKKIAVIGPLANDKDTPIGNWRAQAGEKNAVSLLEGIRLKVGKNSEITFHRGCKLDISDETGFMSTLKINETDTSEFSDAAKIAAEADVVILAVGEVAYQSGEARSRTEIDLPGVQPDLVKAIYRANKNIVLVLFNGRPLTINWEAENIPAIVESWLLGHESGNAIADVLFGDYNPSGKLPMTFPKRLGQVPIYYNAKMTGRPLGATNDIFVSKYIDVGNEPLYPFGYGLSYTTFEYSDLKTIKKEYALSDTIDISVSVTNSGKFDGEEVVQLYIRDLVGSVTRPVKELKGFEKIYLKQGETKTIRFSLTAEDLKFWGVENDYITEPGLFRVFAGGSSEDTIETEFTLY